MTQQDAPDLSVVLITPDRLETIARTMKHLREQSVPNQLEIVIVAPSKGAISGNNAGSNGFQAIRVVEVGNLTSTSEARAAGVRAASAPLVAFVEDHCFPEPGWADALIRSHRRPAAGIGPVFLNANPKTLTSWANLLAEYGPWLDPAPEGTDTHIPGHNSCYRREVLLEYGQRLGAILEAESALHWELHARGYQFRLEPAAKTRHLNFSRFWPSLPLRFHGGRLFAANRARNWPILRRALYVAASPLIPWVRLRRAMGDLRRIGRQRLMPRILPVLIALLMADGFGELFGYLSGSGRAMEKLTDMEFHRERYLCQADREACATA